MKKLKRLLGIYVPDRGPARTPAHLRINAARETNDIADGGADHGLQLDFRAAPLERVLIYLSQAAGFITHVKPNVEVNERVDVWSSRPLNREEALGLLQRALREKGCTAIQDGRRLTIIRSADAKKSCLPISELGISFAQITD